MHASSWVHGFWSSHGVALALPLQSCAEGMHPPSETHDSPEPQVTPTHAVNTQLVPTQTSFAPHDGLHELPDVPVEPFAPPLPFPEPPFVAEVPDALVALLVPAEVDAEEPAVDAPVPDEVATFEPDEAEVEASELVVLVAVPPEEPCPPVGVAFGQRLGSTPAPTQMP